VKCFESESNFVNPAPGKAQVQCERAEETEFKSGKPAWNLLFRLLDGKDKGGVASQRVPAFMVSKLGKALGIKREEDEDGRGYYEVSPIDLEGRKMLVEFDNREYNGKTYTGVKSMELIASSTKAPAKKTPTSTKPDDSEVPF